jgi:hypothetical protein
MKNGKDLVKYDIVKNALIGSAIGACASFVIPFMRPVKGAIIGALILVAIGVYKNLSSKSSAITKEEEPSSSTKDVAEEILKYDNLRKSGAITEVEFQTQKAKLFRV